MLAVTEAQSTETGVTYTVTSVEPERTTSPPTSAPVSTSQSTHAPDTTDATTNFQTTMVPGMYVRELIT